MIGVLSTMSKMFSLIVIALATDGKYQYAADNLLFAREKGCCHCSLLTYVSPFWKRSMGGRAVPMGGSFRCFRCPTSELNP